MSELVRLCDLLQFNSCLVIYPRFLVWGNRRAANAQKYKPQNCAEDTKRINENKRSH